MIILYKYSGANYINLEYLNSFNQVFNILT